MADLDQEKKVQSLKRALSSQVTWAEIDLDAIEYNIKAYKKHVGKSVEVMAVVKANAYGHGAKQVGQMALQAGATRLAVHRVIEGIELRQAGIKAPILIMGYTPPDGAGMIVEWGLTPSLITVEFAQALSAQSMALGLTVPVHVKVDTGMNRFGLLPAEVLDFIRTIQALPGIKMEGLFTHFATADWSDQAYTRQQLQIFQDVLSTLNQVGIQIPLAHAANSAAAMKLPEAHFDAVRPGVGIYGLNPSAEWPPAFEIHPAMTLKSRVSRVRQLPAAAGISYGRTYITQKPILAALVPVGYGDGYHRILSNQGYVLIHGQHAPIIGRICMDQFVVDASAILDVRQDDEVVLFGAQGGEFLSPDQVAMLAGTINYEVTTCLLPRVARAYFRNNELQEVNMLNGAA